MKAKDRKLVLEDGSEYVGYGFGADAERVCEVVFDTSMVGYQEIASDLSYADETVVMTYPLIGNYGITDDDYESKLPCIGGLIVYDYNDMPSNFRYTKTLAEMMEENGIPGLYGIDTRALTRHLRGNGTCRGVLTSADTPREAAMKKIAETPVSHDAVKKISCKKRWYSRTANPNFNVVAIDCGIRLSLIRALNRAGCNVTVVPYNTPAEEIRFMKPDGIFVSNGPGDPKDAAEVAETLRALKGEYPTFGVGLGHQLLALVYGADTYRMKFGHRGSNHPVRDEWTGTIGTVNQNHGYAVVKTSVAGTELTVTHTDLLEGTVEGLCCERDRMLSVQFYPTDGAGPAGSVSLYEKFTDAMKEAKHA